MKLQLTTESCNALMKAYGEASRWQASLDSFAVMSSTGTPKSTISLNSLLDSSARGSQWQCSLGLLDVDSVPLDEISLSSATAALASCNRWGDSVCILRQMTLFVLEPHDVMYNSVCSSLEHSKNWSLATALLHEMLRARAADLISLGLVLGRCSEAQAWREALAIAREWRVLSAMSSAALVRATALISWRWALFLFKGRDLCDVPSAEHLANGLERRGNFHRLPSVLGTLSRPVLQRVRSENGDHQQNESLTLNIFESL